MEGQPPYEYRGEVEYGEGGPWTLSDDDQQAEDDAKLLECGCEPPCTCDLPRDTSSSGDMADDVCVCDPCDCDPPMLDPRLPCDCDPCECDPPVYESESDESVIAGDGTCVCDPCECDPPQDKDGPCVCDPCECELPKDGPCVCDPCECELPPVEDQCTCDPCECVLPVDEECTCDPCLCAPPEERDCVTPPPDLFDATFLAKLQRTLRDNQKKTCYELRPQKPITKLTENIILDLLLKDKRGKAIVYLPGNQVKDILRRRIVDSNIEAIVNVLMEVRAVTTLNLAYNSLTDVGMTALAPAIQECGNIEHLNLMQNDFTSAGILTLCKALMHRSPLQTLRLSGVKMGVEGIEALSCLILCGRVPLDLDLSECDMTVEGFQILCTALHALDHDEDSPNFLAARNLPIDLVSLKEAKQEYNQEITHLSEMNKKLKESQKYYDLPKHVRDRDAIRFHKDPPEPEPIEQFSATLLQGLFDLRNTRIAQANPEPIETETTISQTKVLEIVEKSKKAVGELDKFMKKLRKIRHHDPFKKFKSDLEVPILSEDLYSLTIHEDLESMDYEGVKPTYVTDRHMQLFHGQIIDTAQSVLQEAIEGLGAPDEYTAQNAAVAYVEELIHDAAELAGSTELTEKADVIQLMLMTIVDMVFGAQVDKNMAGDHSDFTEQDCFNLMEKAVDRMTDLLVPEVPEGCDLSRETLKDFVRAFFNTTKGTFAGVLKNPYILKALVREGTLACQHWSMIEQEALLRPEDYVEMGEEDIHNLATQFLLGAFDEAARLVGTGDPFGYRLARKSEASVGSGRDSRDSLESDDAEEYVMDSLISPKGNCLTGTIEQLIDTSAKLAVSTKITAEGIEKARTDYDAAANKFVEDLFNHVQIGVIDREEEADNDGENSSDDGQPKKPQLRYEYVSRPTRLVLNRPIFNHYQDLMGSKLGDFMRDNFSVKVLHAQKWQLGEDGMMGFMEGLMFNTTLVTLDLANNELGADGMKLLGIYIGKNQNLRHLLLNHNRLRDPGIMNLTAHITESGLRSLNIAYNNLTEVGLNPLLTIITSTKINALYLWGNVFGLETWALWKGLLDEKTIRYTDTLFQKVDDQHCIVKNVQVRDTNFWYDVPPVLERGLAVPPGLLDQPHRRTSTQEKKKRKQSLVRAEAAAVEDYYNDEFDYDDEDLLLNDHVD